MNAARTPTDDTAKRDVLVAHAGKQHAYRHALAADRLGRLAEFVTSGYYRADRWPDALAKRWPSLDRFLRRRRLDGLDDHRVRRRWSFEAPEILARAALGNHAWVDRLICRRDARFDAWVARRHAHRFPTYWGFQGSCLDSLQAAKRAGRRAVAEFATAHITLARKLLGEESQRHPEWAATISNFDYPDWYLARLESEPLAADHCIAASSFTRRSLLEAGVPASRIEILPLAADVDLFRRHQRDAHGPLRVLFVGGVGQRKGVKYLLEAARALDAASIEFRLVGPLPADISPLRPYENLVQWTGRVDQTQVVEEMRQADVLVLPSVFEGFGLVIPEAMATGLPVIASTHSIGPEIITDGQEGFVLAPDDVQGLAEKLDWMAAHREELLAMGERASLRAREFSWEAHQRTLAGILDRWDRERERESKQDADVDEQEAATAE